MVDEDEDALICDFAEYYGIYDYTKLPYSKAAIYAWGLPPESRIKLKISKEPAKAEIVLLSAIADRLSFISWTKTKDAEKGKNKPPSILDALYGKNEKNEKPTGYTTIDDYKKAKEKLLKDIRGKTDG